MKKIVSVLIALSLLNVPGPAFAAECPEGSELVERITNISWQKVPRFIQKVAKLVAWQRQIVF